MYPLTVPALRDRAEDIPLLAGHFCERARARVGVGPVRLGPETRERLSSQGVDIETSTPEQLGRIMAEDAKRLRQLIRETGLKLQ